jgi:hypothetical protein
MYYIIIKSQQQIWNVNQYIYIYISFCDVLVRQPINIFRLQKSITTNKWIFYQ